jgi:hypothetical protein
MQFFLLDYIFFHSGGFFSFTIGWGGKDSCMMMSTCSRHFKNVIGDLLSRIREIEGILRVAVHFLSLLPSGSPNYLYTGTIPVPVYI